jgi:hypothetical protein
MLLTSALSAHLHNVAPVRLSDGTIDNAATIAAVDAAARAMYSPTGVGPRLAPLACNYNGQPIYQTMSYGPSDRQITAQVRYFDALQGGICVLNQINDHNKEAAGGQFSWWNCSQVDGSPACSNRSCIQVPDTGGYNQWMGGLPQGQPNSQWFNQVDVNHNCGHWFDTYYSHTSTLTG